ncbi:Mth938-like domain-containing protein [Sphingomonas montanisoli]|uniref:Xcc1710-like domain-containing protein n=1 Tax=Sphingomonas montanisoli TaxID=2606412 RepID=A0A5D9BZU3_9SPHN|nr:MTH938/NDUFAF3 family protein [Sphingomonas montanisoli]TZG25138.1 hypothetical protein FYJ91_17960 [Sphingomonas montanisoli]
MVSFEREQPSTGPIIRGFSGAAFRIEDRIVPGGVILTPTSAVDWNPAGVDSLSLADLAGALDGDPTPEFLLLGTGPTLRRPPPAFIEAVGVGVEIMDSRAAARMWNVLRAEGRWFVAALMGL